MEFFSQFDIGSLVGRVGEFSLSVDQHNAFIAAAISIGTLYCFLGHRTLKAVLAIMGFVVAGGVAALIGGALSDENMTMMVVCGVMGGLAGALAFFFLYRTGIFFLGLLGTSLVAHHLLAARPEAWMPLAIVGIAIGGGIVAVMIERPVVTLATASLGAWIVVMGVAYFFVGTTSIEDWGWIPELQSDHPLVLACWATLTTAGVLAQFATRKRPPPQTA